MTPTPDGWYTAQRFTELQRVQATIFAAKYDSDPHHLLIWKPDVDGNCLGKSLWARNKMVELGWPADALELWECNTELGKKHMILVANIGLADGPVAAAVDCRRTTIARKQDLAYSDWLLCDPHEDAA